MPAQLSAPIEKKTPPDTKQAKLRRRQELEEHEAFSACLQQQLPLPPLHDAVQLFLGGLCYEYKPEHVAWVLSAALYCDRCPIPMITPGQVTMFVPPGAVGNNNNNYNNQRQQLQDDHQHQYNSDGSINPNYNKQRKVGNAGCAIITVERDLHLAHIQNLNKRILCTRYGCFIGNSPQAVDQFKH
ncbi:hypothetical protein COY97_01225, partial [Candidatus Wolfebacteria bacterium CG_4_10_14_0_8_um_filter_39_64]